MAPREHEVKGVRRFTVVLAEHVAQSLPVVTQFAAVDQPLLRRNGVLVHFVAEALLEFSDERGQGHGVKEIGLASIVDIFNHDASRRHFFAFHTRVKCCGGAEKSDINAGGEPAQSAAGRNVQPIFPRILLGVQPISTRPSDPSLKSSSTHLSLGRTQCGRSPVLLLLLLLLLSRGHGVPRTTPPGQNFRGPVLLPLLRSPQQGTRKATRSQKP